MVQPSGLLGLYVFFKYMTHSFLGAGLGVGRGFLEAFLRRLYSSIILSSVFLGFFNESNGDSIGGGGGNVCLNVFFSKGRRYSRRYLSGSTRNAGFLLISGSVCVAIMQSFLVNFTNNYTYETV